MDINLHKIITVSVCNNLSEHRKSMRNRMVRFLRKSCISDWYTILKSSHVTLYTSSYGNISICNPHCSLCYQKVYDFI